MKFSHLCYPLPAGVPMGTFRRMVPSPSKTSSPSSGGALKSRPASHPIPLAIGEQTTENIQVERWYLPEFIAGWTEDRDHGWPSRSQYIRTHHAHQSPLSTSLTWLCRHAAYRNPPIPQFDKTVA